MLKEFAGTGGRWESINDFVVNKIKREFFCNLSLK